MRNAFLLVISPCSPYVKDHRVKGKGKWQLFQRKAVQFTPLSRAHRVQLSLQVSLLVSACKNLRDWVRQICGAPKPKAVDEKQCTATAISVTGGSWLGRSRGTAVVSKGGDTCSAVTNWDLPHPASVRGCQLTGLVQSGLPSLPRGCVNSN